MSFVFYRVYENDEWVNDNMAIAIGLKMNWEGCSGYKKIKFY